MDTQTKEYSTSLGLDGLSTQDREIIERCLASLDKHDIRCQSSANKLLSWIQKGRNGEMLTIVSTACPAYDHEKLPGHPPRYTYSGLGDDIGLAGGRFFRSLDAFHSILRSELSITRFRHEVLVADFEGFNGFTLKRVGVTAIEFDKKSWSTANAYVCQGKKKILANTFSNVFGGKTEWERELNQLMQRANSGEFGGLLAESLISGIGEERRATFEQFFGEPIDDAMLLQQLVVMRASQLATAGKLICSHYENPLILSISDESLSRFFGLSADAPILDMSGME